MTWPVTIRIVGLASGGRTSLDGRWLVEYDPTMPGTDPDGRPMLARIVTTADRAEAAWFDDHTAALREWRRESGLPSPRDRPLTAFTISVAPIGVDDDVPDVTVPAAGESPDA